MSVYLLFIFGPISLLLVLLVARLLSKSVCWSDSFAELGYVEQKVCNQTSLAWHICTGMEMDSSAFPSTITQEVHGAFDKTLSCLFIV